MILRSATNADILAVILGLDRDAAAGVYAARATDDPFALYNDIVASRAELLIMAFLTMEGEAVALIALHRPVGFTAPLSPYDPELDKVPATLMFMAAHTWRPHVGAVLRRALRMRPQLFWLNVSRLEVRLLDRHHVDLARRLGFAFDRLLPNHGRHGETFVQLVWEDKEVGIVPTLDARAGAVASPCNLPA